MREGPLTVVVPVRNEGANLREWWRSLAPRTPPATRVVLVYDDEADDTLPEARRLAGEGAPITLLRNAGEGFPGALLTGLRSIGTGAVLVTMADLSDGLEAIPRMVAAWAAGADVVVGSRFMPGGRVVGGSWLKRALGSWGSRVLRAAAGFPVRDASNAFRVYDAAFVRRLAVPPSRGFEVTLALLVAAWRAGAKVVEVPATWQDRTRGSSHFRARWLPRYGALWLAALRHGLKHRLRARRPGASPDR